MRHAYEYRCEATTLEGFVQQLAVCYVGRGYHLYVTGRVPERKDARAVDRKLIERYDIGVSKFVRARRKRAGWANLQYIRFERFFVILATRGLHPFFREEGDRVRDCGRGQPITFGGYAIGYGGGHACVRIQRGQENLLKAYFLELATRRPAPVLESALHNLPFEPYAPVIRQLSGIVRAVNRSRKAAGLGPVSTQCLRLKRRIVRPFDPDERGVEEGTAGRPGISRGGESLDSDLRPVERVGGAECPDHFRPERALMGRRGGA